MATVLARRGPAKSAIRSRQPASPYQKLAMLLLLLEALAAGCLLVLIVWWTMFSGRKKGERTDSDDEAS